jgi:hypothetical protein
MIGAFGGPPVAASSGIGFLSAAPERGEMT